MFPGWGSGERSGYRPNRPQLQRRSELGPMLFGPATSAAGASLDRRPGGFRVRSLARKFARFQRYSALPRHLAFGLSQQGFLVL